MENAFPTIPDFAPVRPFPKRKKTVPTKPTKKTENNKNTEKANKNTENANKNTEKSNKRELKVEIWVDDREHALLPLLGMYEGATIVCKTMAIGDMALVVKESGQEDGKMVQIYERKTMADLLASIQDGRYKEQSFRMLGAVDLSPHNMVYVIEGRMVDDVDDRRRVLSAMTSIQFFKGMSVMRTVSLEETAELLVRMAEKVERELQKNKSEGVLQVEKEYVQHGAALIKRANITKENVGEIMLCCVPGISAVTAKAILARFGGSFVTLLKEVQENPTGGIWKDIRGVNGRRVSSKGVAVLVEMLQENVGTL